MEKLTPEQIERLKLDSKKYYEYAQYFYVHDLPYYKEHFEGDIKRRNEIEKSKNKKRSMFVWGTIGLCFIALAAFAVISSGDGSRKNSVVENSSYDGSVRQCKNYLKDKLNDPDSYEPVEWSKVSEVGNGYLVRHKYRAKNGFGAMTLNSVVFKLDTKGEVIEMLGLE